MSNYLTLYKSVLYSNGNQFVMQFVMFIQSRIVMLNKKRYTKMDLLWIAGELTYTHTVCEKLILYNLKDILIAVL